ncbi:USP42 family protein [Megaselia abdita]
MPVSVVCEAASAALRESLANSCGGVDKGNNSNGTNGFSDPGDAIQSKFNAKRVLLQKIEYEEVSNYGQAVLDNLKTKYIILKPNVNNGASSATVSSIASSPTATTTSKQNTVNGNKEQQDKNELPQPKRILFPREKIHIGWKQSPYKWNVGAGMTNVGNTCYLNSTLQALFHVPAIANWLMSDKDHRERCEQENGVQGGCIVCAMAKTLIQSQQNNQPIRPHMIYSKLRLICKHMMMGRQEDAHEFLRYLVEAMEKSYLNRFRGSKELDQHSKETTPMNQILGGYLKTAVRCLSCSHVSTTFQHFEDILLDIRKSDSIEEALDTYFARERLEDMGYKCESCKKKVTATKQFFLERAPISLCIQLKRFSIVGTKLNKHITIKPRLDLSKYSSKRNSESWNYRLVSMITHLGSSQHCGHYTAIGMSENDTYHQFDDSYVRQISVQNVLNTNAYVIFYELDNGRQPHKSQPSSTVTSATQNENKPPVMIGPQLPTTNGSSVTKIVSTPTKPSTPSKIMFQFKNKSENDNKTTPNEKDHRYTLPSMPKLEEVSVKNTNVAVSPKPVKPVVKPTITTPVSAKSHPSPVKTPSPTKNPLKRSLVPYESESDDEEELENKVKLPPTPTTPKNEVCLYDRDDELVFIENNSSTSSPSTLSPDSPKRSKSSTPSPPVIKSMKTGIWQVTSINPADGKELVKSSSSPKKSVSMEKLFTKKDVTVVKRCNSDSGQVVGELLKMSHRGYGAPVLSWNGKNSAMEKELNEDKFRERKREAEDDEETEMDRGRQKKVRMYREDNTNPGFNPFQATQNQQNMKNRWKYNSFNGNSTNNHHNNYKQSSSTSSAPPSFDHSYSSNHSQSSNGPKSNPFNKNTSYHMNGNNNGYSNGNNNHHNHNKFHNKFSNQKPYNKRSGNDFFRKDS